VHSAFEGLTHARHRSYGERINALLLAGLEPTPSAAILLAILHFRQQLSGFNPIAHTEKGPDGSWVPATNAWMHQKVGVKQQVGGEAYRSSFQTCN
jgi:hypothetical protein